MRQSSVWNFRHRLWLALLAFSLLPLALAQGVSNLTGHVTDNTQRNVANLQVRMRPPQDSNAAAQIGVTDQNGVFSFSRVRNGQYLLEISQGPYVLYRQVLNLPLAGALNITVQRR